MATVWWVNVDGCTIITGRAADVTSAGYGGSGNPGRVSLDSFGRCRYAETLRTCLVREYLAFEEGDHRLWE